LNPNPVDIGPLTQRGLSEIKGALSSTQLLLYGFKSTYTKRFDDIFTMFTSALQKMIAKNPVIENSAIVQNATNDIWDEFSLIVGKFNAFFSTDNEDLFYVTEFIESFENELDTTWLNIRTSLAMNLQECYSTNIVNLRAQIGNGFFSIKNCLRIFTDNSRNIANLLFYKTRALENQMGKLTGNITSCSKASTQNQLVACVDSAVSIEVEVN
jgi:hypothetical protein